MIDALQFLASLTILALLWSQNSGSVSFRTSKKKDRKVILDTCALIDGRIVELAKTGFVPGELVIPEFIVHELQLLADGSDAHKRTRARFGLDIVQELQQDNNSMVVIDRTKLPGKHAVDDKLVALAKKLHVPLYTTDYNLNKVAEIEGVKVLNVNELAQQLRPTVLPGEVRTVKIVQKGNNPGQGAGYLEDGTLLVVENGAQYVGKTVKVEITKTHQTASGKMLFGELVATKRRAQTTVSHSAARQVRSLASRLKR